LSAEVPERDEGGLNAQAMQTPKIKCYRIDDQLDGLNLFVLSKGNNAGKPLKTPCPNCFILTADNEYEKEKLYWLLYCLWQGGYFQPYLTGSVIPFIRIDDLKAVLTGSLMKIQGKSEEFIRSITLLRKLEDQQKLLIEQMRLIKQAKRAIMFNTLK